MMMHMVRAAVLILAACAAVTAGAGEGGATPEGLFWAEAPAGAPVIDRGPDGAWDAMAVDNPFLFVEGDALYCFYEGQDKPFEQGGHERIGLAVSKDGVKWEKWAANPILDIGPAGSWDALVAKLPVVTRREGMYYLFYSGRDGLTKQIGLATSPDLHAWTKHPENPVLRPHPGAWDAFLSTHPAPPMMRGGLYHLLFRGMTGLYTDQALGLAVSEDLIHWRRLSEEPVVPAEHGIASFAVAETPDGYVGLSQSPERTYWHSDDLSTWRKGAPVVFTGRHVDTLSNPVRFRDTWLVVYEQQDRIYRAVAAEFCTNLTGK